MNVYFSNAFYERYTSDPAAAEGRMDAVVSVLSNARGISIVECEAAGPEDIAAAHTADHIASVRQESLYDIASLAAGGAIQAAMQGLREPAFGLVRPPGHHASADSAWGFCFFNNMAIALMKLKREEKISSAYVLDIDMHYGDGTENILGGKKWVGICNPSARDRRAYLSEVETALAACNADMIGVSAGFDYHMQDWGGVLATDDYREIGRLVRQAADRNNGGCFGILEGGYNHDVLGENALAFINGLSGHAS